MATGRSVVMTAAICSCARTIGGASVCPTIGTQLPRNIPSNKMKRLYSTRFLSYLDLALFTTDAKERTPPPQGPLGYRLNVRGGLSPEGD